MTATYIEIDQVLADSFPASDPPSWVSGHAVTTRPQTAGAEMVSASPAVMLIPDRAGETWSARAVRHARSAVMAVGVVLLMPIYVVALPIALVMRGLLEASNWRLSVWK